MAPVGGVRVVQASNHIRVCSDYIMQWLATLALRDLGVNGNVCPNTFKKIRTAALITTALVSSQDLPGFGFDQFRQTGLQAVSWQYEIPLILYRWVFYHTAPVLLSHFMV